MINAFLLRPGLAFVCVFCSRGFALPFRFFKLGVLGFFLLACSEPAVTRGPGSRILAMGDSLLAANSLTGRSVSHSIESMLGEQVVDRSIPGASILYGLPITGGMGLNIGKQFSPGNWDWIVLNGGGNDLMFGCGCRRCDGRIEWMISGDGRIGEVPDLVARLRQTGAQIIYVGYLRSPGVGSPIESCRDEGDKFEARIDRMANATDGVYFLSLADLVPFGDRSFHGIDMIHPSAKASREIGRMVAGIIATNSR